MPLGTDIVKISRMERVISPQIPKKIFTENEIAYINTKNNKAQSSAGIFAAKEAVLKAFGTGIALPLNEVEILHAESGAPYLSLLGNAKAYSDNNGFTGWEISISHDGEYAVAVAMACADKLAGAHIKIAQKLKYAPQNAITRDVAKNLLSPRKSSTHKGDYGRLYVLAGSIGLTGAAIMACTSALKCGAGRISLGCAKELNNIFEISLKEVMTKPLQSKDGLIVKDDLEKIIANAKNADMCLIGPGLGRSEDLTYIVKTLITSDMTTPLVIDADGLNAISEEVAMLQNHKMPITITPHIGEFARLTGLSAEEILKDTQKHALEFAKKHNVTVVLKSHQTVVASPGGEVYINILGNPGMATGGTGDVLAGAVASFGAQGKSALEAALLGVYIHSYAADLGAYTLGEYSLTPSDITDNLAFAIKNTVEEMQTLCVHGQK